jgi:hypothetical protein
MDHPTMAGKGAWDRLAGIQDGNERVLIRWEALGVHLTEQRQGRVRAEVVLGVAGEQGVPGDGIAPGQIREDASGVVQEAPFGVGGDERVAEEQVREAAELQDVGVKDQSLISAGAASSESFHESRRARVAAQEAEEHVSGDGETKEPLLLEGSRRF